MKTAVYLNPAAGSGRASRLWSRISDSALGRGVEVIGDGEAMASEKAAAERAIDAAIARRPTRLIAIGGDGTASLVANRILDADAGRDIVFGLVPAGTGSDWAAALGLPRSAIDAFHAAAHGPPRPIDAIEVMRDDGSRRFAVNIASIGVSGAVDQAANRVRRRTRVTYLAATIRALLGYRPRPWRLILDDEPLFRGELFVAAFANGRSFGGGMKVAPDAVLDDGLADVIVVPPVPLVTLPWRLPQFLTGRHVHLPFVRVARGQELRVEPAVPLEGHPPFDLDGETLTVGAATFRLRRHALEVATSRIPS